MGYPDRHKAIPNIYTILMQTNTIHKGKVYYRYESETKD